MVLLAFEQKTQIGEGAAWVVSQEQKGCALKRFTNVLDAVLHYSTTRCGLIGFVSGRSRNDFLDVPGMANLGCGF